MPSDPSVNRPRIVLDTNNLVSSRINRAGASYQIYQLFRQQQLVLCTSPFQLNEMERVLNYPRIKNKFNLSATQIKSVVTILRNYATVVYPTTVPDLIREDPDDNHILAIAKEARADTIVSGDRHLLSLKHFQNIPILTAEKFLSTFKH